MKNYMQIGNRKIGEDYAPLVIAEIGINHEGSLKTAFEMVDAAYEAGAEVIKHQTHVVEDEMSKAAKEVIPGNTDVSIYAFGPVVPCPQLLLNSNFITLLKYQ